MKQSGMCINLSIISPPLVPGTNLTSHLYYVHAPTTCDHYCPLVFSSVGIEFSVEDSTGHIYK